MMEEAIQIDNRGDFGLWAIEVAKQIVADQGFELARAARDGTELGRREGELPRKIRLLLHKHILVGNAAWEEVAWKQFCGTLVAMFDSGDGQAVPGEVSDYCGFVGGKEADAVEPARQATKQVTISQATIRLGSIHSVTA
ncbi:hypothetical protein JS562_03235 [Agrobacterium sp. S2]|nr:hypothetical protein [Agrobacterium sp. S2]